MKAQPIPQTPVPADTVIPVSEEQLEVYKVVAPHYREQLEKHPNNRWLKSHYDFIVSVIKTKRVYSYDR